MNLSIEQKLEGLTDISQKKLLNILGKILGNKDLIIDDYLMKPLERIIGTSKLRSQGVDKLYKLNSDKLPLTNVQRVFLINSDLKTAKRVCDRITSERSNTDKTHSYHVILVSRKLHSIDRLLEEEGLHGVVNIYVFQWELIPLDKRLLTLECNHFYKSLFIEGDHSFLHTLAKSIWTLHLLFGRPYLTLVQGKYSEIVYQMVQVLYDELGRPDKEEREISHFLIVDRDVDYVSTLLTGVTYTSLLDEEFGINAGVVEIKKGDKSQVLNSSDTIFDQIKSRHFSDVFPFLSRVSKELQITKAKTQELEIAEMRRFLREEISSITGVKKSLAYHIGACEAIIEQMGQRFEGLKNTETSIINSTERKECLNYIEESLIMNICNRYSILRLICLLSITQDGLTQEEYTKLKTLFLQMYGYKYLPVFHRLEQANLCTGQGGIVLANKVLPTRKSAFSNLASKLKLIPTAQDEYNCKQPKDAGYVFGGLYIPVVCQIVNLLAKEELTAEEVVKLVPHCSLKGEKKSGKSLRNFVVYFVGGVTYPEISAFQLLEKLLGINIIVAASSIINGNSLMKNFFS